jgi:2-polyprenyl-6-methoxyphenol hydroxylase-like FAD-dependent oxidoreductase
MKVLIVGAGIAGLTLANFLEAFEIEYEIVERSLSGDPERQGFIIGIWSTGRSILKKLGLAEQFDACASPTHEARFSRGNGSVIRSISYRGLEYTDGAGLACIRRTDLHTILNAKLQKHEIRYNQFPTNLQLSGSVISVTFNTGDTMAYDVVVGADGAKSFVREYYFKEHIETFTNWRVWCTWVSRKFETRNTLSAYIEPNELAVVVHTPSMAMAWLVTPMEHDSWDTEEGRAERVKKYFKDIQVLMPSSLDAVPDANIRVGDFMEVTMSKIVQDRCVLIGDAAHCLGPYTGFSSSIAMEDAYVLAVSLLKAKERRLSIDEALADFESRRLPRIELLRRVNALVRGFVLSKSRIVREIANAIIYITPSFVFVFLAWVITRQKL